VVENKQNLIIYAPQFQVLWLCLTQKFHGR
jgi:hypothetical protein